MNPMQSCSSTTSCGHLTQDEYPRQLQQLLGPYEQELHDQRLQVEAVQKKEQTELDERIKERRYLKISEPMDPITDSFGVLATQKHMAPVSFQETSFENFLWMRPLNEDEKNSSSKGAPLPRYKPWGPATEGASRVTQGASQTSCWGLH